jgi:hypothetical protein
MKTLHSIIVGLQSTSSIAARRIALPLVFLTVGLALIQPCAGQSETWTETGSLNNVRARHTATLLPSGKALVAGGAGTSAELYDPASGTWSTTGSLNTGCDYHTATLLQNGMALVAGSFDSCCSVSASAELYDPASGTWTFTGNLNNQTIFHTATLLQNGMVLVAGGCCASASAELYDPASGTWTATGSLNTARFYHTATLLPDGQVLAAGGQPNGDNLASPKRGTLRSGKRDLDGHRQPQTRTL